MGVLGTTGVLGETADSEAAKAAVADGTTDVDDLEVLHRSTVSYESLEEAYVDWKVFDPDAGSIEVVRTDGDGSVVDKEAVERRAGEAYERRYGLLEKRLYHALENADPDQEFDVAVQVEGPNKAAARSAVDFDADPTGSETQQRLSEELQGRIAQRTQAVSRAIEQVEGATVLTAHEGAPLVDVVATSSAIESIERLERVDTIWHRETDVDRELDVGMQVHDYARTNVVRRVLPRYSAAGYSVGIYERGKALPTDTCLLDLEIDPTVDEDDVSDDGRSHAEGVARAAAGNDDGAPGVATGATVYATNNTAYDSEEGPIDYLKEHAPVVNTSFGGSEEDHVGITARDIEFGSYVFNKRIPIVNSSGNNSVTTGNAGGGCTYVSPPSRSFNVISVSASDTSDPEADDRSDWDVEELRYDVSDVGSCTTNPRTRADDHTKPELNAITGLNVCAGGKRSATSFAAPQVAGLITLLKKFAEDHDCSIVRENCAGDGTATGGDDPCADKVLTGDGAVKPEVARAVTMAAAEPMGDYRFEESGAGTLQVGAAEEIIENNWFVVDCMGAETSSKTYSVPFFEPGQVVTVTLSWLADLADDKPYSDPENAHADVDLDLLVKGCSWGGCSTVASSTARDRAWEHVRVQVPEERLSYVEVINSEWHSDDSARQFCLAWHVVDNDAPPRFDVTRAMALGTDLRVAQADDITVAGGAPPSHMEVLVDGQVVAEVDPDDRSSFGSFVIQDVLEPDTEHEITVYGIDEAGSRSEPFTDTVTAESE